MTLYPTVVVRLSVGVGLMGSTLKTRRVSTARKIKPKELLRNLTIVMKRVRRKGEAKIDADLRQTNLI